MQIYTNTCLLQSYYLGYLTRGFLLQLTFWSWLGVYKNMGDKTIINIKRRGKKATSSLQDIQYTQFWIFSNPKACREVGLSWGIQICHLFFLTTVLLQTGLRSSAKFGDWATCPKFTSNQYLLLLIWWT